MIAWKKQEDKWIGALRLQDGSEARVVLTGPRNKPGGAVVVTKKADSQEIQKLPLENCYDMISPACLVDILCQQEWASNTAGGGENTGAAS